MKCEEERNLEPDGLNAYVKRSRTHIHNEKMPKSSTVAQSQGSKWRKTPKTVHMKFAIRIENPDLILQHTRIIYTA